MVKPSLLIIIKSDSRKDPRTWRQICYLKDEYDITVAAFTDPSVESVKWLPLSLKRKNLPENQFLRKVLIIWKVIIKKDYAGMLNLLYPSFEGMQNSFDAVICHDPFLLGWFTEFMPLTPVVFDAHEYYPRMLENSIKWRVLHKKWDEWICKIYIPKCAGLITVSNKISEEYKNNFPCNPVVIKNAPKLESLEPRKVNSQIKIIHHGSANPERCIEHMIDTVKYLDERFTLDLMLTKTNEKYYAKLKKKAMKAQRVNWIEPVAMQDIAKKCNEYDIGLYILPEAGFDLKYALPNKLFEFVQARLAIAIGPSIEMEKIVKKHNLGVVSKDFSQKSMAEALNSLTTEDIIRFKRNSHQAAQVYNAENEMEKLKGVLRDVRNIRLDSK